MTTIPIPSLRKVMVWLFIIMVSAFAVGMVFYFFDAPEPDRTKGSWVTVYTPDEPVSLARIHLELDTGSLSLTEGNGPSLLAGQVHVTRKEVAPRLLYLNTDGTATVSIDRQSDLVQYLFGDEEVWELALNREIPSELSVISGAGDISVASGRSQLSGVELESGFGSITLDLTGWSGTHLAGILSAGVGEITVLLPDDAHIAIALSSGFGNLNVQGLSGDTTGYYYHPDMAGAPSIDLAISQGIGGITIRRSQTLGEDYEPVNKNTDH